MIPGEKVLYSGSMGFTFEGLPNQVSEMVALASSNARCKDPMMHLIVSLQDGESMTKSQAIEQVNIILEELNLKGHQVIWGVHIDTENVHLHIAINRINPISEKAVKANGGWYIEGIHKAIARIEKKQGFRPQKNSRYHMDDDGVLQKNSEIKSKKPNVKIQAMEIRIGEKSAIRIAIDEAGPILKAAKNWQELHEKLEAVGMTYERKGSGALIFVGETPVKASDVERNSGFSNMVKRLGPYEKNAYFSHKVDEKSNADIVEFGSKNGLCKLSECTLASRSQGEAEAGVAKGLLQTYARPRGHFSELMQWQSIDARRANVDEGRGYSADRSDRSSREDRRDSERASEPVVRGSDDALVRQSVNAGASGAESAGRKIRLAEPLKIIPGVKRWDVFIGARRNHFAEKNSDSSIFNASISSQYVALKEKHDVERKDCLSGDWKGRLDELNALRSVLAAHQAGEKVALKEKVAEARSELRVKHKPFPIFEEWLKVDQGSEAADLWRVGHIKHGFSGDSDKNYLSQSFNIRDFAPVAIGSHVNYYDATGSKSFTDTGRRIVISEINDASILASMQLAKEKFGFLKIDGDKKFKALCVEVAAKNGIRLKDPDLQFSVDAAVKRNKEAEIRDRLTASIFSPKPNSAPVDVPVPEPKPAPVPKSVPELKIAFMTNEFRRDAKESALSTLREENKSRIKNDSLILRARQNFSLQKKTIEKTKKSISILKAKVASEGFFGGIKSGVTSTLTSVATPVERLKMLEATLIKQQKLHKLTKNTASQQINIGAQSVFEKTESALAVEVLAAQELTVNSGDSYRSAVEIAEDQKKSDAAALAFAKARQAVSPQGRPGLSDADIVRHRSSG